MLKRVRRRIVSFGFFGTLLLITGAAQAAEVTLRLHHFLPTPSVTHAKFLQPWVDKVTADSGGRIEIQIYPSMQLGGKPPQLYDQVRDGVVDLVWTLPGYNAGRFPLVGLFELPFMVGTAEATSQAVQAFAERHLQEEFGDVRPLLFHVHARGSLHMKGRPVRRMEDLKGAKVRAPNRAIGDALAALGASPIFMPVPQVPDSLAKGVVEGAALPFEVTLPLKVHELVDSHTEIAGDRGLYTAVFLLAMNKQRYESLPEDLRQVIDANSGIALARQIGRLWDEAEEPGRAKARDRANSFFLIDGDEAARWQEATAGVTAAWVAAADEAGKDGAALLEEARALIAGYGK